MITLQDMFPGMVNSPETFITAGLDIVSTEIAVEDLTGWPEPPFVAVLGGGLVNAETVKVTGKAGNILTVERAHQGIAQIWPQGTAIAVHLTEGMYRALVDNIKALNFGKVDTDELQAHADTTPESAGGVHGFEIKDNALHILIDGELVEIAKIKRGTNALGNAFLGAIRLGG